MPVIHKPDTSSLTPDARRAYEIYESKLREILERDYLGQAVAINPKTGDYAVGPTRHEAVSSLRAKQSAEVPIIAMRIGPPTPGDIGIAQRIAGRP